MTKRKTLVQEFFAPSADKTRSRQGIEEGRNTGLQACLSQNLSSLDARLLLLCALSNSLLGMGAMELCVAFDRMTPSERCGCGAKSEVFGRRITSSSSGSAASTSGLGGHDRIVLIDRQRRKGRSLHFDQVVKAEKRQPWSPRNMARRAPGRQRRPPSTGEFAEERDERRDFAVRAQRAFAFQESAGVGVEAARSLERSPNCKWRFMSAAAAAGLSWTLCSSAVASPSTMDGPAPMTIPTAPVSENLRAHVETQLRRELQAQIKVQKDWLDEIGQPLSQWSIDERVRKSLEEKSRSRLDESGKAVSKLEMLESEVVPIFRAPVSASSKEKVANAGSAAGPSTTTQEAPQDNKASSQAVVVEPKESSTTVKTPPPGVTELVAVAALPLGPVVSAATRTVGSAASMAAMQASGAAVPGVSLVTRIMTHFGGGGVAGAMGATLVYPLDTIKTRMQAQSDVSISRTELCRVHFAVPVLKETNVAEAERENLLNIDVVSLSRLDIFQAFFLLAVRRDHHAHGLFSGTYGIL